MNASAPSNHRSEPMRCCGGSVGGREAGGRARLWSHDSRRCRMRRPPPDSPQTDAIATPAPAVAGQIEAFLAAAIGDLAIEPARPPGQAGRPRVFPSLCVWAGLLVCVLRGFSHQQQLWRLLSVRGLWSFPRLLDQISAALAVRLAPYLPARLAPFASEVVALDATTLDAVCPLLPAADGGPPTRAR